jgi:hypothetical protein
VRFVARRFSQKEGVDYEETFAPIARYASIQAVISIASIMMWRIHQMDVKTVFLNEIIEEEVYIEQPNVNYLKLISTINPRNQSCTSKMLQKNVTWRVTKCFSDRKHHGALHYFTCQSIDDRFIAFSN